MKTIITSLFFLFSFCFTSCVEEEFGTSCVEEKGGVNSDQKEPRDSKPLVPTEIPSSYQQLEQHKSTDKALAAYK